MPIFVFGTQPSSRMTTTTLGDAARRVAFVAGAGKDPAEVGATEAIQDAIRRANGHQWEYMTVRGDDIPLFDYRTRTVGQEGFLGRYTMPVGIRDFTSGLVRFSGTQGGYPLHWIKRADWDARVNQAAMVTSDLNTQLGVWYVSDFGYARGNQVELLANPTAAGTMELRFYGLIPIPSVPDVLLLFPDTGILEAAIIKLARADVANNLGLALRSDREYQRGELLFTQAMAMDAGRLYETTDREPDEVADPQRPIAKRYAGYGFWS